MNKLSKKQIKKIRGLYQHFLKTNLAYVDFWSYISRHKKLSESFIREFSDKVDWTYISWYQKLSESFIKEFCDKVDWYYISKYQQLSEEFIREFSDKVDWMVLCENKKYNFKNVPRHVKLYLASNHRELLGNFK